MNDKELFDFLVATDELDDFLGYEPKCPECGNKLVEIVYDMPDIIEEEYMSGDINPKYHCNTCERSYFENLKDYIDEENT